MIKFNAKQFLLAAVIVFSAGNILADASGPVATAPAPANYAPAGKSAPASTAALPTGATVTTGTAAITTSGQHMTITPNQPKTWINWQSYNVAAGHSVTYNQGAGSLTVNQVVGQNMSTIAGQINVTGGTAVLINENGLVFKDGAKIDGNMVFSTQPVQHSSFMAGNTLRFEPSQQMGKIEQSGTFTGHGLTAFVGPQMALKGDIHAALKVYPGDRISMHFNGDKLMGVDITEQAKAHNIEVNNVTGAHIKITAAMAEQAVEGIINVKGHLQATDMDVDNGTITINGGNVTVEGTAKLTTQGGAIRVGVPESYNSVNSAQRALVNNLLIKPGAELDAGAGNIFLLAQNYAEYHGTYTTQGGLIELSARKSALYRHTANLNGGTLALDPATLTIVWDANPAGANQVSAQDINTQLQTGSVFLQAEDNITLDDLDPGFEGNQIIWDTDYSLSMKAATITLDGNITYTGGAGSFGRLNLYTTIPGEEVTGVGEIAFPVGGSIRTFNPQVGGVALNGPNILPPETIVDQYQVISTIAELQGIGNDFVTLDRNYALGNNIDIGDVPNWTPIGGGNNEFRGKFTGDNLQGGAYEIQNMKINTGENDTANVGLFGATSRATIDHLRIHIAEYSGTGDQRGGLVGAMNLGTLHNVGVIGDLGVSVSGTSKVGGLIGYFTSGGGPTLIVTNCFSTVNVGAVDRQVGGLIGHMLLVNSNTNTISKSYATGNVNAKGLSNVGGLIGDLGLTSGAQLTISESFTTGSVSHEGDNINDTGGLIGHINALNTSQLTIENSFSLGKVVGSVNVGGLIGYAVPETDGKITIRNSYSTADVSGNNNVGGSIGFLSNSANITVTDVYSSGAVTPPGDPDDPNIGVVVENPTITYNVNTDTPGRITEASLFNNTLESVPALFLAGDSPWAIPTGKDAGRAILHLPGTAIPVVPEVDNIITDVVVNNHAVSLVTLNDIPHYFIPPRTAYTVSGFSLRQSDNRTLEKAAATAYQVIDFFLPPTPQPTVTVGDDNDDGINIADLDEEEDFVVDTSADIDQANEIAEIGDAIEGLGESELGESELGDSDTAVTAGDNDDEDTLQGASAGATTVAGPREGTTALAPATAVTAAIGGDA